MTNTPLRPARAAHAAPAPVKSGSRRWAPWIVGGVFALVAAGGGAYVLARGGDEPTGSRAIVAASATDAGPASEPVAAEVVVPTAMPAGRKAHEGTLSVSVTKTECGVTSVGPPDLPLPAEGEFCLVSLTVQNTGKEERLLDPGAQRAVDLLGRSHKVAEQAAVFVNDQDPSLLDEIPPGTIRQGVVPFDVPKGARLAAFMLHQAPWSTGVRVPLS